MTRGCAPPSPVQRALVPGFPVVNLAFNGAASFAFEVIVDGSGYVPMRTIDNLRRPDGDGREKARRTALEARRHGVVHHL